MEQRFEKLVKGILAIPAWLLLVIALFILIANNFLWPVLSKQFAGMSIFLGTEKWAAEFRDKAFVLFYAPVIETLVFQYLLLHLFLKFLRPFFAIIASGLVFGFLHFYNPFYFIGTVVSGLIFACVFYIYWKRKGELFEALFLVILIHSAGNAISLYANQ